jgi:hypothetical protein
METNHLRHSESESARRARAASANIRDQTPEEKVRTDAQVADAKARAGLGTAELQRQHHVKCQLALHAWTPTIVADLFG